MRLEIRVPDWARSVYSDLTDMHRAPHPVDAGKVARFTLELPDDVRFEYAFVDGDGRVRADPDRGANGANPWYPEVTEVRGPAYRPHPLADPPASEPAWRVRRHKLASRASGGDRRVTVVSPPDVAGPLPVVVLHDGVAYQRLARAADVLAELVRQGRGRPAHLAFLEPGDRQVEYAWDERHVRFVHDEVRPLVAEHHATGAGWWALGASLGGLAAATLALHAPEDWTGIVAQGGAFLGTPDDRRHHGTDASWLADRLEGGAGAHLRWVLDVGRLDWLHPVNQRVRDALADHGADVAFAERSAGHNWGCWRDGLADALTIALRP
ncbi:MAG: alpha/beta hydrolase-fold protein [Trueperaceae bacterium]|nr:alpha/beta hydrolase-fold protein [Trueperaceae bacterium]